MKINATQVALPFIPVKLEIELTSLDEFNSVLTLTGGTSLDSVRTIMRGSVPRVGVSHDLAYAFSERIYGALHALSKGTLK